MKHVAWKWSTLMSLSAVAALGVVGCADKNGNGQPDSVAPDAAKQVDKAVDATKDAATKAVDSAETVAENAATTGKIKAAYAANASIKALNINVDTMSDKKMVMLSGMVQNPAQKKMAEQIAKQNAPAGFKIDSAGLKTGGGASPKMVKPAAKMAPKKKM